MTHGGSKKNLLGDQPDAKLVELMSNEKQVTKNTPPTFIFQTIGGQGGLAGERRTVLPGVQEGRRAGRDAHLREGPPRRRARQRPKWTGGEKSVATWPDRLADWMKSRGLLEAK